LPSMSLRPLKLAQSPQPRSPTVVTSFSTRSRCGTWIPRKFDIESSIDNLTVRFIDDAAFTFDYRTSGHNGHNGHNGHSGHIAGIGKMLNLNQGIFDGVEDCELLFDFYAKKVDIDAAKCQEYGGQRANFGGSYMRK